MDYKPTFIGLPQRCVYKLILIFPIKTHLSVHSDTQKLLGTHFIGLNFHKKTDLNSSHHCLFDFARPIGTASSCCVGAPAAPAPVAPCYFHALSCANPLESVCRNNGIYTILGALRALCVENPKFVFNWYFTQIGILFARKQVQTIGPRFVFNCV